MSVRPGESDMEVDHEAINPLNMLISAATTRNPVQYQLPNELSCTIQLPGRVAKFSLLADTLFDYFNLIGF